MGMNGPKGKDAAGLADGTDMILIICLLHGDEMKIFR